MTERNQKSCQDLVKKELLDREEDFERFERGGERAEIEFHEYGLDFSYVERIDTTNNKTKAFFRYQLSWGGPSDEIRFYKDGTIEYWYMDWFDGACLEITKKDWAQWLWFMFALDEPNCWKLREEE